MKFIFILLIFLNFSFADEKIYANFDVLAVKDSKLVFEANGIVKKINVDVSSVVKKGDKLVLLDDLDEKIALKIAQNELENAKLVKDFKLQTLNKFKQVEDDISKYDFEKVKFDYENALIVVKKAQIAVENINNRLSKKTLIAPFSGVIVAKNAEIGSGVIALNSSVLELVSYPEVKIVMYIDGSYIDKIKVGDEFYFDKKDGNKQVVKISNIYPIIDIKTRKFKAEAYTDGLTIGSYGEGFIKIK
ncbi:efflux RND transporter periplasmic adaptor subunit [Campylobacter pinnipediorum]|uniref:efflux RND transporter periplasmic adaptor subunit n=1 Tax=Campylobacter pinnipediorum TaxID=1965231 RepID=UPI00084CF5CA|nr:efflux RND transporter periplasmic adaptor subunit [Campylobacter pinnipediorum]OPA78259.1 hypothetical protein BFG05_03360 [Campylobacter pinnipediorum subsp. pinnipediorum]